MATGDDATLARVLADFASIVADENSVDAILSRLNDYCTELLPVHGIGVLLRDEQGSLQAASANTELGMAIERLESELGEGPCTDALQSGEQVTVPDLSTAEDRWPRFVPRALELGVRAIHGLPLTSRTDVLGAVDIIALEPTELSAEQIALAQLLTDVTVAYLANSQMLEERTRLAEQLQTALDRRTLIEQAKGMLAERHGIGVTEAFERIRTHARSTRTTAHSVAEQVLEGRLEL